MTIWTAFVLGCGFGALVAGVVITYAVMTFMPQRWRRG